MTANNGNGNGTLTQQRIIGVECSSFKKLVLVDLTFDPDDNVRIIGGANDQGKSTLLDGILATLCGADWVPDEPIRSGQDSGSYTVTLTDYRITRLWRRGDDGEIKSTLTIEAIGTGATVKKPATWLKEHIGGSVSFDGLAFARMGTTKQGVRDQAQILRDLIGLDTSTLDGERDKVYAERTQINRQVDQLKAKLAGMPVPDEIAEPPAEIDVISFLGQLEKATTVKAANDRLRETTKGIADILAARKRELDVLVKSIATLTAQHDAALRTSSALVDPDIDPIRKAAEDAKVHNAKVRATANARADALRRINERDMAEQELKDTARIAGMLTDRLNEIEAAKTKMLAEAKFPVPGLGLDADGHAVTFNGKPYSQAATSQQIKVGMGISIALNAGVRATIIRDGSLLDDKSLAVVREVARAAKIDVFIERVGVDDENVIVIEEGRVKAAPMSATAVAAVK